MPKFGERFLHDRDSELHTSDPVEHEQERKAHVKEDISQKPAEKISDWLSVIEKTHMGHRDDPRVLERIKRSYHEKYVINPANIPEGYFENQRRLIREQGHGDIEITEDQREQLTEVIIADQESTLDTWVDYLSSEDSDSFPTWAKYWSFEGMRKLGSYDKEKHAFSNRGKDTVAPFPDLNREALAYVLDVVGKKVNKENIPEQADDPEFQKLLQGTNFGKMYAWAIEKVTPEEESELLNTKGEWIKYDQGSDHMPLVESLQGHGTGWCTAGESTANHQLESGDFYVYYSDDKKGSPTIPRIAIRMQGRNKIAEVRGIASDQNLDPYILGSDVLDEKLQEFGDEGESYTKKTSDMKRVTEIDKKNTAGEELTKDDLRFVYELDSSIEGFGYQKDPRIEEMLSGRDIKEDISVATGFTKDQISTTKEEALQGGIKFHYGTLDLNSLTSAEGLELPETIGGYLNLSSLTFAEGLKFPEMIGGYLALDKLTSAEGLNLPETIGGNLSFNSLTSAEGLKFPETIGGDLYLTSLTSAEGLKLPENVGGSLALYSLTSAEGLKFPETIGGSLYLSRLTSAEGLEFSVNVSGSLDLSGLTSAEGLKFPETIGGDLDLSGLTSAEDLKLPETIDGVLSLSGLTYAENLKLPENVGGDLDLNNLTSAKGLELPENVGGNLDLHNLTSAEGLKLPDTIGGDLYLTRLTSAEGLKFPENVGGDLYLNSLTSVEIERLREEHPQLSIPN